MFFENYTLLAPTSSVGKIGRNLKKMENLPILPNAEFLKYQRFQRLLFCVKVISKNEHSPSDNCKFKLPYQTGIHSNKPQKVVFYTK